MTYEKKKDKEIVTNGRCQLDVVTIKTAKTKTDGRLAKIMVVRDIIKPSPGNMVWPNQLIALSFPEDKINGKKYEWGKNGPEECQVPFTMNVPERPKTKIIRG